MNVSAKINDHIRQYRAQVEAEAPLLPELHALEMKLMKEANAHCFRQQWEAALYLFAKVLAVLEIIGSHQYEDRAGTQISHAACVQRMDFCLQCMGDEAAVEAPYKPPPPIFLQPARRPISASGVLLPFGTRRAAAASGRHFSSGQPTQSKPLVRSRTAPSLPVSLPGAPSKLLGANELRETMMERVTEKLRLSSEWIPMMAKVSVETKLLMKASRARERYLTKLAGARDVLLEIHQRSSAEQRPGQGSRDRSRAEVTAEMTRALAAAVGRSAKASTSDIEAAVGRSFGVDMAGQLAELQAPIHAAAAIYDAARERMRRTHGYGAILKVPHPLTG